MLSLSTVKWVPKIQRSALPPSYDQAALRLSDPEDGNTSSFEESVTIYQLTLCNIRKDVNLQQRQEESL
jgi:hypothetical protein